MLPSLSRERGWPIDADHCFMRVCLDTAVGRPWHESCARPAIRHLPDQVLARAVAIAERCRDGTASLDALNDRSIAMRRASRRGTGPADRSSVSAPPTPHR